MLALGADATMLGRAFVYALAADGAGGVENLLGLIERELRVAMALTGATAISQITRELLVDEARMQGSPDYDRGVSARSKIDA